MTSLRVAVVKPDWGIRGGFEIVLDRLVGHLESCGHRVDWLAVDAYPRGRRPYGRDIPDEVYLRVPQFFDYVEQYEACQRLDTHLADVVISTQPPSFAVHHERHLSIFYHHQRWFYDLAEPAMAAGLISAEGHAVAMDAVRRIDTVALANVTHVLAGSETVARRLADFSGRTTALSVLHAGPSVEPRPRRSLERTTALCISRHNFPKRTELFVHAMHLAPEVPAVMVGAGGRLGFVLRLDRRWSDEGVPDVLDDADTWLNTTDWIDPASVASTSSNIRFETDVDDETLYDRIDSAFCLVAPALLEDYGLTAIEAMQAGVPVITCTDSGHLTDFVEHEVTGLVVEPTGSAIAAAVRRLAGDRELAERMGAAAREVAGAFTWKRTFRELDHGLEAVL